MHRTNTILLSPDFCILLDGDLIVRLESSYGVIGDLSTVGR